MVEIIADLEKIMILWNLLIGLQKLYTFKQNVCIFNEIYIYIYILPLPTSLTYSSSCQVLFNSCAIIIFLLSQWYSFNYISRPLDHGKAVNDRVKPLFCRTQMYECTVCLQSYINISMFLSSRNIVLSA